MYPNSPVSAYKLDTETEGSTVFMLKVSNYSLATKKKTTSASESGARARASDFFPDNWFGNIVWCGRGERGVKEGRDWRKECIRQRFSAPKSVQQVEEARMASIPKKTQQDTNYCFRIWSGWRIYRNSIDATMQVPLDG